MLKRVMAYAFAALLAIGMAGAQELFEIKPGKTFTFLGPQGQGKATTISIVTGLVVINAGTSDEVIGDLVGRDIVVQGPNGGPISLREMRGAFAPATPSGRTDAPSGDVDSEFDAIFEGMPAALKRQLKAQFAAIPREDALKAIKLIRGQMNLPPVDLDAVPQRPASGTQATGNTRSHKGQTLREVLLAGDRIWVADARAIPDGTEFVAAMTEFSKLFTEISGGLPIEDASILRIGELKGGFPYIVEAASGEVFEYSRTDDADIRVPKYR